MMIYVRILCDFLFSLAPILHSNPREAAVTVVDSL